MAAQFVRFGLITLVSDKRKNNDSAIIFTVRGSTSGGNSSVSVNIAFSFYMFLLLMPPFFSSKPVNFAVLRKLSTRSQTKAVGLRIGIIRDLVKIPPMHRLLTLR